jgi:hypothetical membrane protein
MIKFLLKENDLMKRYQDISFVAAILAGLCYLAFAVLAFIQYPMPYSPLSNWLSDLGNVNLNPQGATLYNIGIIMTALLLLVFFLGLSKWRIRNNRVEVAMLRLTQAFGVLGSISMVMSAVYPMDFLEAHSFWSAMLYIMLATAFVFLVATLRYHRQVPRWLLILGLSTALIVILTSFMTSVDVLEWITVFLFLLNINLVGVETKRLQPERAAAILGDKIAD